MTHGEDLARCCTLPADEPAGPCRVRPWGVRRLPHFHPLEHQNIDQFLRAGWEFYPASEVETKPNPQGLPWHPSCVDDGGKVRWNDHWLMYRSRDYEDRARRDALKKWNSKREARKGPQEGGFVGTAHEGVSTVDKILRERQDDEQDRDFLPR